MHWRYFRFPHGCARCGAADASRSWPVGRWDVVGRYRVTQSIAVPVCAGCEAALVVRRRWRAAATAAAGLTAALLVRAGAAAWGPPGAANWVVAAFNGAVVGGVVWFVVGEAAGLRFARLARAGRTIRFAHEEYQREFDRVNGLPGFPRPAPVTHGARLGAIGYGVAVLLLTAFLAFVLTRYGDGAVAVYLAPLVLVTLAGAALVMFGLGLVGRRLESRILDVLRAVQAEPGDEERLVEDVESHLGRPMSFFERPSPSLPPAVGWGVLLGFLAAMIALVVWVAQRE